MNEEFAENEDERTAFHEAGHAAMAFRFNDKSIHSISMTQRDGDTNIWLDGFTDQKVALCAIAGTFAEACGIAQAPVGGDFSKTIEGILLHNDRRIPKYHGQWLPVAIDDGRWENAVFTDRDCEYLSNRCFTEACLATLLPDAAQFNNESFAKISKLASELIEKRSLNADEIIAILR